MGCHPKPIDFHSIIFQDGYIKPPTSVGSTASVIRWVNSQRLPRFRGKDQEEETGPKWGGDVPYVVWSSWIGLN